MKRAGLAAALAFVLGSAPTPVVAAPCAGFTDVQDTDTFCNSVQWLKNRQITLGCTATMYCPSNNVTRAQMASFLNRTGVAVSPKTYFGTQNDQPAPPVIVPVGTTQLFCITAPLPTATYPRTAVAHGYMSVEVSGSRLDMYLLSSANRAPYVGANFVSQTVRNPNGPYPLAWSSNPVPLIPGSTYTFAIGIGSGGSIPLTIGHSECMLDITVVSANPTSPPFDE